MSRWCREFRGGAGSGRMAAEQAAAAGSGGCGDGAQEQATCAVRPVSSCRPSPVRRTLRRRRYSSSSISPRAKRSERSRSATGPCRAVAGRRPRARRPGQGPEQQDTESDEGSPEEDHADRHDEPVPPARIMAVPEHHGHPLPRGHRTRASRPWSRCATPTVAPVHPAVMGRRAQTPLVLVPDSPTPRLCGTGRTGRRRPAAPGPGPDGRSRRTFGPCPGPARDLESLLEVTAPFPRDGGRRGRRVCLERWPP